MGDFLQTLRNLGTVKLSVIGSVFIVLLVFFIFLFTRLGSSSNGLLYSNLNADDKAAVVSELSTRGVRYTVNDADNSVYVPTQNVRELRMELALKGIPSNADLGYEIFDESNALGQTSFQQNVSLVRAMEGELERTIKTIDTISNARVHLVLPKREVFTRETIKPSASVAVKMVGRRSLSEEQIGAIKQLVATAVPQLTDGRITIIDSHGRLLAAGGDDESITEVNNKLTSARIRQEHQLEGKVEHLLENTVGYGKVRATVKLTMDYSQTETTQENFDPDGQVARSTTSDVRTETSQENPESNVSVGNQVPQSANQNNNPTQPLSTSNSQEEQNVTNYEISKTVTHKINQPGRIEKISVAILVDGTYTTDAAGARTYAPRTAQELTQMRNLVSSAVGIDSTRGDTLEIVNMQFTTENELIPSEPEQTYLGFTKAELLRIGEVVVLAIIALLVVLLIVRPMITRIFESQTAIIPPSRQDGDLLTAEQPTLAGIMQGEGGAGGSDMEIDDLIDVEAIEDRVQATSGKKIAEIVANHPTETLAILRGWMYEDK